MSLTSSGPTFHPGPLNHATPSNPIHSPALSSPCVPPISCFPPPPSSARLPRPWRKLGPLAEAGCKSPSCTCSSTRGEATARLGPALLPLQLAPLGLGSFRCILPPSVIVLLLGVNREDGCKYHWTRSRLKLSLIFFGRPFVNNLMLLLHYSC